MPTLKHPLSVVCFKKVDTVMKLVEQKLKIPASTPSKSGGKFAQDT